MIPLARDTRESIGAFADKVENRSLLFDKMVLAKTWGHGSRFNDANRFNVLRTCTGGTDLLSEDSAAAQRASTSPRASEDNKRAARYKSKVAGALAGSVKTENMQLLQTRSRHSNQFSRLLEASFAGRIETFVGSLRSRLLINMAGGVMENAGLALDRCFGLPYIPGSAAKGAARSVALWDIKNTDDPARKSELLHTALLVFGFIGQDLGRRGDFTWAAGESNVSQAKAKLPTTSEFKGVCSFLPAYPCSDENLQVVAECMTPHPPAEDSASGRGNPRPLFYPAVEAGSSFAFAIIGQRTLPPEFLNRDGHRRALEQASLWLRRAVTEFGVGAKTGAGYGWFSIDALAEEKRRQEAKDQQEEDAKRAQNQRNREAAEAAEKKRRDELTEEERLAEQFVKFDQQQMANFAKNLEDKNDVEQIAFCTILAGEVSAQWKIWKKSKKWKGRIDSIREIAAKHGITLS